MNSGLLNSEKLLLNVIDISWTLYLYCICWTCTWAASGDATSITFSRHLFLLESIIKDSQLSVKSESTTTND